MIDNFGNQIYPGSVDNGATDTEHSPIMYPPKAERICAADERHEALDRRIHNLSEWSEHFDYRMEELESSDETQDKRIAALETQVHRLLNTQPVVTISQWPELQSGIPQGVLTVTDSDYAHIPAAEWEAICAELEALRAKWASVPWESIERLLNDARNECYVLVDDYVAARQWLDANAPKPEDAE